jgi:hypothetical protein
MKDKPERVEHRGEKPCVCRIAPISGLFLRPTHQQDDQGQEQVKCWVCGRTAYQAM